MSAFYFCVNSRHDITKLRMTSLALPTAIFLGRIIVKYLMRETENLNITKPRYSARTHQFCKSLRVAPRQFYWVTTVHCHVSIFRATTTNKPINFFCENSILEVVKVFFFFLVGISVFLRSDLLEFEDKKTAREHDDVKSKNKTFGAKVIWNKLRHKINGSSVTIKTRSCLTVKLVQEGLR